MCIIMSISIIIVTLSSAADRRFSSLLHALLLHIYNNTLYIYIYIYIHKNNTTIQLLCYYSCRCFSSLLQALYNYTVKHAYVIPSYNNTLMCYTIIHLYSTYISYTIIRLYDSYMILYKHARYLNSKPDTKQHTCLQCVCLFHALCIVHLLYTLYDKKYTHTTSLIFMFTMCFNVCVCIYRTGVRDLDKACTGSMGTWAGPYNNNNNNDNDNGKL